MAHVTTESATCAPIDIIVKSDDDPRMNYAGGKGKCYQRLINLMPPHNAYIESHLGGGAVMRHKRPAVINIGIDMDASVIERWRVQYHDRCTLQHGDAVSFLAGYRFSGGELVYADPPYVPSTRRRKKVYRHDYTEVDHERLLETLKGLPCMVMISGYENDLYRESLSGWRLATFPAKTHAGVRTECVWMNFPEPTQLHDPSFLGDGFRDRQTVRRKHQRIIDRFGRMDSVERSHLLATLATHFG